MQINNAIRLTIETCELKHLSLSTQKSYTQWLRRYGLFLKDCKPDGPETTEQKIEAFLTHLATTHMAASTQNQAFNALLFFYREVLKQPLGPIAALRAKRPATVRDCPSQAEVLQLLSAVTDLHHYRSRPRGQSAPWVCLGSRCKIALAGVRNVGSAPALGLAGSAVFPSAWFVPNTFNSEWSTQSQILQGNIPTSSRPYDDGQPSRDVAFSGVAAFTSRSDASWPPAGIIKATIADFIHPTQFGHCQPRGKKVTQMDKVVVAASQIGAIAEGTNELRAFKN
jgi:Phage integrase, N-terminal SAM-like domain